MNKKFNFLSIFMLTLSLMLASSAFANKAYVVNTDDTSPVPIPGSLRYVIQNANNGDTIIIDISGVVVLQSQIVINQDLTIIGPGPIHFRIDGSNVTVPLETGFVCHNGSDVHMEGIQFENFSQDPIATGGSYTGTFSVVGCAFNNNSGTINVDGGEMNFSSCSFLNTSGSNPVVFVESNGKFVNCTFHQNAGGGVWVNNGVTDIVNCTFFENGVNVGVGLAIRQVGGTLNLRNNIIFNDTQTNALIEVAGGATMNSQGGNITNDEVTLGAWTGSDIQSLSVNSGLSIGSKIRDGWGLTYFPPSSGSDGIDIDNNPINLPLMDQRRVWRVMDAGAGNLHADAGAVEYTPLTINNSTSNSPGSFDFEVINTYPTLVGKTAFVFEFSGPGPFNTPGSTSALNLFKDSTIVNGFSQDSSRIPGPGVTPGTITSGYTQILMDNANGNYEDAIAISGDGCIIAGLSIGGFTDFGAAGIRVTGANNMISGCHLGVNATASNNFSNTHGAVVAGSSGAAEIGSGHYCGNNHHANRNIISGNTGSQVRIQSPAQMKISNNIIGLNGVGLDKPIGTTHASDTGIITELYAYTPGSGVIIGDADFHNRNIIGDQTFGIVINSNNNKVYNNYIGSDYTGNNVGATTPNVYGIEISDPSYSYYVEYNWIGEQDKGNVIVGNTNDGVSIIDVSYNNVFGNHIGVGKDGVTPLGNGVAGIYVEGSYAVDNKIGEPGKANVIGDNEHGIELSSDSYHSIVKSNLIGVGRDSLTSLGNTEHGIYINYNSSYNVIGGCSLGEGNVIGNNNNGIIFELLGADYDTIRGNYIGTTPAGLNIGNTNAGIMFVGDIYGVIVGDTNSGCGNEIAYNGKGIVTSFDYSGSLTFSGNSIHDNVGLGIDLDDDGTPDYTTDDGLQSNNAAPIGFVSAASSCSGSLNITITPETTGNVIYEVFKADAGGEEGDSLIAFALYNVQYYVDTTLVFPVTVAPGMTLVMTATQADDGSTSEFGAPFTVSGPPAALTPSISHAEVCFQGSTYPELTVPSSTGTAVWFWDGGPRIEAGDTINAPEDDLFINGPGTFNYYVVDSVAGCYGTPSSLVSLDIITPPTYTIVGPDTVCTNQTIQFSTQRPSSFNSIFWYFQPESSPGTSWYNDINFTNPSPGSEEVLNGDTYSAFNSGTNDTLFVEIDSAGCYSYAEKVITVIFSPDPDGDSLSHPTTCGGTDGYIGLGSLTPGTNITLYHDGGTATPITIDANGWAFLTGLGDGSYTLDSISNGVCISNLFGMVFTLTEPIPQTVTAGPDQTICEGDVATLTASPSGGVGPFTYAWDNGAGTSQTVGVTPVVSTTYVVTVTDNTTACEATDTITVTVDPLPVADAGVDQVICFDTPSLTLSGVITNAPGASWSTSGTGTFTPNLTTLTADYSPSAGDVISGSVTLTLTTNVGGVCPAVTDDMIITINPEPNVANPLVTDVTCFGGNDGSIQILPSGTYTYSWTGPNSYTSSSQDIFALETGTYSLTMTDGDGCMGTFSGVVNQPSVAPQLTATGNDLICNNDGSGMIVLSGSSGLSPYQYQIDGGGFSTNSTFSGLAAGSYVMSMEDANGCPAGDTTVTLLEPTALIATVAVTSNYNGAEISCVGALDGELTASNSGGTGAPTYEWYDGATLIGTTAVLTEGSGTYGLVITDANGCTASSSGILTDPTALTIDNILTTDPSCNGTSDGVLEAVITSGTVALDYVDWYDDMYVTWVSSDNPYNTAPAGTYYVEAVDLNGCVTQGGPATLLNPAPVSAIIDVIDETCSGYADGQLDTSSVTGGTGGPYSVEWLALPGGSSLGFVSPLNGLAVGDYVGVVQDGNGCEYRDTVTLNAGETYTSLIVLSNVDSCVNSNSFDFADDFNVPPSGAAAFSWTFTGATPSTSSAQYPTGIEFNTAGSQEVAYEVTSNMGCVFGDTIYVDIYAAPAANAGLDQNVCEGDVDLSATPNGGGYTYEWTQGGVGTVVGTTADITLNLTTSAYYVVEVTDITSGCVGADSASVFISAPPTVDAGPDLNVCAGDVDLSVTPSGGAYTYEWTIGGTSTVVGNASDITLNMTNSEYYVAAVTETSTGCIGMDSLTVFVTTVPVPSIDQTGPITVCYGDTAMLTVTSNNATTGTFTWYVGTLTNIDGTGAGYLVDSSNVGNHYLLVSENDGTCESLPDSVQIVLTSNDVVNNSTTEFCLGDEVIIDVTTVGDIYWYDANGEIADTLGTLTTALPTSVPRTYAYEVVIGDCIFMDSITFVEDANCTGTTIVNNAFTPNGDGVNDLFSIDAGALLSNENKVTIINRWGDVINEYTNYDNTSVAWDGTNTSGNQVPAGTYFYVIEVPSLEYKATGWIQVVR